jgi:hypothetical protein
MPSLPRRESQMYYLQKTFTSIYQKNSLQAYKNYFIVVNYSVRFVIVYKKKIIIIIKYVNK